MNSSPHQPSRNSIQRTLSWTLFYSLFILLATPTYAFASPQAPSAFVSGTAKQQPNSPQTEDIRTVYVTVTDNHGVPITDLKREDFSVIENREPQQIVEVSSGSSAPLIMFVLVDSSGSERSNSSRLKNLEILSGFLATAITASDRALIGTIRNNGYYLAGATNDLSQLRATFDEIAKTRPWGSTALYDSLYTSAEAMLKDHDRRKIILVLSDFQDNASRNSLENTILRMQQTGASVFALLELDRSAPKKFLKRAATAAQQISSESGGLVFDFESSRDLERALSGIQIFLRNPYELKYRATGQPNKAKIVPLKIEVQRKGASVFAPRSRPPATP